MARRASKTLSMRKPKPKSKPRKPKKVFDPRKGVGGPGYKPKPPPYTGPGPSLGPATKPIGRGSTTLRKKPTPIAKPKRKRPVVSATRRARRRAARSLR